MSDSPPSASQIWVDADACPGPVKEILFRAAERARVPVTLVANQWLRTPGSRFIRALQVQGGFDAADDAIAERAAPGDLVVTQSAIKLQADPRPSGSGPAAQSIG